MYVITFNKFTENFPVRQYSVWVYMTLQMCHLPYNNYTTHQNTNHLCSKQLKENS